MKRICFSIFLILYNSIAFSQGFWTEVISGVTTPLWSTSNINGNVAWVCGDNGVVLITTNSGYNWQNAGGNGIPSISLYNIFGLSDQFALTSDDNGTLYRTTNRGINWTQVFTQPNGFINAVWMSSNLNGFMVGDPVNSRWSLFKTTNGGLNWDSSGLYLQSSGSEAGWNNSMWLYGNNIWFGTSNSRIYYSSNGGTNWIYFPLTSLPNSYAIGFNNNLQIGYAGGENLLKTTNNGFNWTVITAPGSGTINSVAIDFQQNYAWFTRSNNSIYSSNNNGLNWTLQYTAPSGNFNHMGMLRTLGTSIGLIYAVRSNGGISRCSGSIEGVKIISGNIPKSFNLYQNYPNPFNSETHIKFETPKFSSNADENRGFFIRLTIYNLYGQLVEKRVAEVIQPGTYEDIWNGSQFSSGVYFYRLTFEDPSKPTGGNIIRSLTKKMILLK